jgi:hypothetical protein
MQPAGKAAGQVVFLRTDASDYTEEIAPFATLEELVRLCSEPRPHALVDKVQVFDQTSQRSVAVTLGFLSASRGQRLPAPQTVGLPHS